MSSIEKLSIRGIRSFSPATQSVIEFYTPLTIIVGQNGAGKTTIIECLKYATTGDMPPNSKGGAFVHDPKLVHETEVKAQIRLKFYNIKGQPMVITRSLQSTQKRTKLEQKTLEALLVTNDPATGEQVSISSRCAELDAEIPMQLGISKAVLDNVIFCHQEESFWPLSEPSILKKKFDDIFAATKYTKALDTIKVLRKELSNELKLEQQKLDYLKIDKDKAAKIRLSIETAERQSTEAQQQVAGLNLQIESIASAIDRLSADLQTLISLQNELERLNHELGMNQQTRRELCQGLKIMSESDSQLMEMLERHLKASTASESDCQLLQEERKRSMSKIDELNTLQTATRTEKGVLMVQVENFRLKQETRSQRLAGLCRLLELTIYEPSALEIRDEMSITRLVDVIRDKIETLKAGHQAIIDNSRSIELTSRDQKQRLEGRKATLEESRRMRRKMVDEHRQTLAGAIQRLAELGSSAEIVSELEERLVEEEIALENAREFVKTAESNDRLGDLGERKAKAEQQLKNTSMLLAKCHQLVELRAKIDLKRTEKERKEDILRKTWQDVRDELETCLGYLPTAKDVDQACDKYHQEKENRLKSLQEQVERTGALVSAASSKHDHLSIMLERKHKELNDKTDAIRQLCSDESFEDAYKETEAKWSQSMDRITNSQSKMSVYRELADTMRDKHNCPLCEHSFSSKNEEDRVIQKIDDMINVIFPRQTVEAKTARDNLDRQLQQFKSLRSVHDDIRRLRLQEIPELAAEANQAFQEKQKYLDTLDDLNSEAGLLNLDCKKAALLFRKAEEIGKQSRELKKLESDIKFVEQEIGMSGGLGDFQSLQEELVQFQEEILEVQKEIDDYQEENKSLQAKVQTRDIRVRDIRESLMKVRLQQTELTRLEQQKMELESTIARFLEEIRTLEQELQSVNDLIADECAKFETFVRDSDTAVQRSQRRLDEIGAIFGPLVLEQADLERHLATNPQATLGRLEETLIKVERELASSLQQLQSLDQEISTISKKKLEVQVVEREIRDNMRIRELDCRNVEINGIVSSICDQIGRLDRAAINVQLNRNKLKQSDLMGERSGLLGETKQLHDQIVRLHHELDGEYPNVEDNYRQQFIKVQAMMVASEDLEKYSKALDQAIMKYHALKMDEINKIIREIWTSTYQGTDIDTIEIRADHEIMAGNRSYNYRVIMLKGDTELDMRGRSSAGQRVLTSLIIRLALAETFGLSCGILALDEPTTNLDRDNIEGLAESLAQIIASRRQQNNFQLIIITHDEEFVQQLAKHECADHYWRVFRDQNQCSVIERQSIGG